MGLIQKIIGKPEGGFLPALTDGLIRVSRVRTGDDMKKKTPLEKIPEALTAIADDRVHMFESYATVESSDRKKTYTVTWNGDLYTSSDSATYWQGYAGYPVIAVLMLQNRLALDKELASWFGGVNWAELNAKYKREYAEAVSHVMAGIAAKGGDINDISSKIHAIHEELHSLPLTVGRGRARPPGKK